MPLSQHIASLVNGLRFNLDAFSEHDWGPEVRNRLIDESVGVLDELLFDPSFKTTLESAYRIRTKSDVELRRLRADGRLLNQFVNSELVLLKSAGVNDEDAETLANGTKRLITAGLRGSVKPQEVFNAIVRLRFALIETRARKLVARWPKAARSLAVALGGSALVGLNASGLALTLGIVGPLATVSATGGVFILKEGAKGVIDYLKGN